MLSHHHGLLDQVSEFADVGRPGMRLQKSKSLIIEAFHVFALFAVDLLDEVHDQQFRILEPLAQRRNRDLECLESVVEIGGAAFQPQAPLASDDSKRRSRGRRRESVYGRPSESPDALPTREGASREAPASSRLFRREKTVPPFACSKIPGRRSTALVKAPRSCPNSSLSIKPSPNAAQFFGR
jgi:hypothetical protein